MSDFGWTAALVVVSMACLVLVLLPVFRTARAWDEGDASELDRLLEAKGRVLRAIKDLDHEREAGLLTEDDWRVARDEQLGEAVRLNREVTARTGVHPVAVYAESAS